MISSIASGTQIYSINQVTKTRATSAYSEATPTSPVSRMEQMQEKYKDVYSPMPVSYSKEREDLQLEKIREVYPDMMSLKEAMQWVKENLTPIGIGEVENSEDKIIREARNKEYIDNIGGEEAFNERIAFIHETRAKYPTNKWAHEDFTPSNIKELTAFYNVAVYEGLEEGKDLKTATSDAYNPISFYINTSESATHNAEKHLKYVGNDKPDKQMTPEQEKRIQNLLNKHEIGYGDAVDLRSYGFNMEWNHFDTVQNDNAMVSMLQQRVEMYDFMLENPSVVESAFLKLDGASQGGRRTSERAILEPIRERHLPNSELALDVFKKYKIYNSIDMKA